MPDSVPDEPLRRRYVPPTRDPIARQLREAEERGDFLNLPGLGKPLDLSASDDDFLLKVIRREGVEGHEFLPPSLRLAKQVENLADRLDREPSEARARSYVEELNREIRAEIPKPQVGPPLRVRPVDVDAALAGWAARRAARLAARSAVEPPAVGPAPRRRSWFRRRPG